MYIQAPDVQRERLFEDRPRRKGGGVLRGAMLALLLLLLLSVVAGVAALLTGNVQVPWITTTVAATDVGTSPAQAQAPEAPAPAMVDQRSYGDWLYGCLPATSEGAGRCSIRQQLVDSNSNAPVFIWHMVQDGSGSLAAIWQASDGVLLSQGILIDANTPEPIRVPFRACGNGRCEAVAGLAPEFLGTLSNSAQITVTLTNRNGQAFQLPISTSGLADGLAALQAGTEAAPSLSE